MNNNTTNNELFITKDEKDTEVVDVCEKDGSASITKTSNQELEDRIAALEIMSTTRQSNYSNAMPLTSARTSTKAFDGFLRKGDDYGAMSSVEIPAEAHQQLIARVNRRSPLRERCQCVTTSANYFTAVSMPEPRVVDGKTVATADHIRIDMVDTTCNFVVPHPTLQDDCIDAQEFIHEQNSLYIANEEERKFVRGTGNNEPQGILVGVTDRTNAEMNLEGLRKLYYSLDAIYRQDAVWVMNSNAHRHLASLFDQMKWKDQADASSRMSLFGNDIIISNHLPDSAPVVFGNLKLGYCVVEHAKPVMLRDIYTSKPNVEFTTTRRYGGRVVNASVIKVLQPSDKSWIPEGDDDAKGLTGKDDDAESVSAKDRGSASAAAAK